MGTRGSVLLALCFTACTPPNIAGDPLNVSLHDDKVGAQAAPACTDAWKQTELSLMGWDAQQRGYLGALHRQGVVAVHYEVQYLPGGCTVSLELLSNCHAQGTYQFESQPVTDHKLVHNDSEVFAQLPLGAANIKAQIKGDRAFRADFMYAGIDSLPFNAAYRTYDLTGPGCERATHIINRVYVGGFAWTFGESRALDASASLFTASVGGGASAKVGQIHSEGSPDACERAQKEGSAASGCQTPLHIGLLPIEGVALDLCSDVRSCTPRCDGGDANSCNQLAVMYAHGTKEVHKDTARAVTLLERACKGSSAWGCTNLGDYYLLGKDVRQDLKYAASLYEKACAGGVGAERGCISIGSMYAVGNGMPTDPGRAIYYYGEACSRGETEGCRLQMPLLVRDCERGVPGGCNGVGYLYEVGAGVPIDVHRAQEFYTRACDMGLGHSCTQLGKGYEGGGAQKSRPKLAARAYEMACKIGEPEGCFLLGIAYENGNGVEQNPTEAADRYDQSCKGGYQPGCMYLGDLYLSGDGVTANPEHAAQLFGSACDENIVEACEKLAALYQGPEANKDDIAAALALYRKACSLGDPKACDAASQLEKH